MESAVELAYAAATIRKVGLLRLDQYNTAQQLFRGKPHIEVFHDESSDTYSPFFRVAAFVVGFKSEGSADQINDYISKNGPRFWGSPNRLPQIKGDKPIEDAIAQWRDDIAPALAKALDQEEITQPFLLPFVIVSGNRVESPPADDPYALLDPTGLDNINQELLRLLLEVLVVDTLAWISGEDHSRCCVYGATRMRYRESENALKDQDIRDQLRHRWEIDPGPRGIRIEQNPKTGRWGFKWQSLRRDSLHLLLNELVAGRNKSAKGMAFARSVYRAYCTPIPGPNADRPLEGYRFLHSVADPIARLVDIRNNCVTWDRISESSLPLRIRGAAGLRTQIIRILNCHRALDEDDLVDGFGYGLGVNHEHDVAGNVVALRLRELIPRLSGKEFLRIVGHVKAGGPRWTHSPRLRDDRSEGKPQPHNKGRQPGSAFGHDAFREQKNKWRIKRFAGARQYATCGTAWHEMEGFHVRMTSSGKIIVFAELGRVCEDALHGFNEPDQQNLFRDDGLCGRPYPASVK